MRYSVSGWSAVIAVILLAALASPVRGQQYDQYDLYSDAGIYELVQDVEHHFYEARVDFETKKFDEASDEILTAVTFLKLEANRAKGKEQEALVASIGELEQLADRVREGKVTSVEELHDAFARAQFALAMNSWVKAREAWMQQDFETATRALKASQAHLGHAIQWKHHPKKQKEKKAPKTGKSN